MEISLHSQGMAWIAKPWALRMGYLAVIEIGWMYFVYVQSLVGHCTIVPESGKRRLEGGVGSDRDRTFQVKLPACSLRISLYGVEGCLTGTPRCK